MASLLSFRLSTLSPPIFMPLSPPIRPFCAIKIRTCVKALEGWREYEDAVRGKDLARALQILKSIQISTTRSPSNSSFSSNSESFLRLERDWEVLDTCLNADDMRLVGSAYKFLQDRGFLDNFGKYRNIVLEGPRDVTPTVLKESTGLEACKLSPKKWGLSGTSRVLLLAFLGGTSFLVSQGIDIRPNLAAILALAMADAIFLGGSCLAQILCFWPPYRRRVLVHEAGHLLTGDSNLSIRLPYSWGDPGSNCCHANGHPRRALSFGMKNWKTNLQKAVLAVLHLTGTAWYSLPELQLKPLYMGKLKVEKMMRTCSGVYVFSYDLH